MIAEVHSVRDDGDFEIIFHLRCRRSFLGIAYGEEFWRHYFGNGTVWHDIHTGERAEGWLEEMLANEFALHQIKKRKEKEPAFTIAQ